MPAATMPIKNPFTPLIFRAHMAKMERVVIIVKEIFEKYMTEKATIMPSNQLTVEERNIRSLSKRNLITSESRTADIT